MRETKKLEFTVFSQNFPQCLNTGKYTTKNCISPVLQGYVTSRFEKILIFHKNLFRSMQKQGSICLSNGS